MAGLLRQESLQRQCMATAAGIATATAAGYGRATGGEFVFFRPDRLSNGPRKETLLLFAKRRDRYPR